MERPGYRTIVADPPWHYEGTGVNFRDSDFRRGERHKPGQKVVTPLPYGTMRVDEIAALPVADMCADDAHLYLWTTQRYLRDAFTIVDAWGFKPSATLVWCKPPVGWQPGGAYMNTVEFAIYARRGKLAPKERCSRQWWEWKRGAHSAKPEAFMDIVEQVSPGPYLEMFSRRARLGWDTWGNESLHGGEAHAAV